MTALLLLCAPPAVGAARGAVSPFNMSDLQCATTRMRSWVSFAARYHLLSIASTSGRGVNQIQSPYEKAVEKAATNDSFLRGGFKRSPSYAHIVATESVKEEKPQVTHWLEYVERHAPHMLQGASLQRLQRHLAVGNPFVFSVRCKPCGSTLQLSASMLKYAAQAAQITKLFVRVIV